ncbi:MAG: response regulator [Ancalomicrobiaceae bacterium]|nr:response regulator [Ancalomicrobiaceae bacterium]
MTEARDTSSEAEITDRVVIVDDDDDVRLSLANLLQSAGFSTSTFNSGESLVAASGWDGSHCLIVDVRMKGMNGIDLVRLLRERRIDTPAFILTAQCDEETRRRALRAGATGFICKPFDEDELIELIGHACEGFKR